MPETSAGQATAPLELGREYVPEGEDAAIEKLRTGHLKIQEPHHRGEHPKHHAGLWATFTVEADVPEALRAGLFAKPGDYTAFVRFSNGRTFDDREPDVHAIAVKVLIPGQGEQDFLLADHPVFFAENVERILEFLMLSLTGAAPPVLVAKYPKLIGFKNHAQGSMLGMSYWSQTPYRLGAAAVKYYAVPSAGRAQSVIPLNDSKDCLREALTEQLTARKMGAKFDFCVIPQTDAGAMPVEDPTIEWTSPPVKLATIAIYPQKFDSAEQMTFVENTTWSPWHSLPEHAPIGGINRARRMVYLDSQALRHKTNGVASAAFTGREWF